MRRPDFYYSLAKEKSYPARSVFKLEEIDRRTRIIPPGGKVLDLGASPGSWLKYISQRVGASGTVVGVDVMPLRIPLPANSRFIQADIFDLEPADIVRMSGTSAFDAVVSDLAPKTTGVRHADQENSWRLFEKALSLALGLLTKEGCFTGKLFFSPRHKEAVERLRLYFGEVRTLHPKAVRKESKEVFLVAKRFKGTGSQ